MHSLATFLIIIFLFTKYIIVLYQIILVLLQIVLFYYKLNLVFDTKTNANNEK